MAMNSLPSRNTMLVAGGFAAWFGVTVLSQHPAKVFDRLRDFDPLEALIPNWRFFAPEPIQQDFHIFHRVVVMGEPETPWKLTSEIADRSWSHFVWFPAHRVEKGLIDICSHLHMQVSRNDKNLTDAYPYLTLRDYVRKVVLEEAADGPTPDGFQFLVARACGFDEEQDPDYLLVSPYVSLESAQPAPAA